MDFALPAVTTAAPLDLATLRVRLCYLWRHGRLPNLTKPTLFTELVQHRKLTSRDRRMAALADKVGVKAHVAETLGPDWIIPTLWHGDVLPAIEAWPRPFVVKSRHGCNQTAFLRSADDAWDAARTRAARWMSDRYGWWLDEWAYGEVPRGVLVEPFVGDGPDLPIDYKFYVFGGRVDYVQVHLGRGQKRARGRGPGLGHRWVVLDRDWQRVSSPTSDVDPARPDCLAAMIAGAEALARGFDFVRVDLYAIAGRPKFGEMTFYPGSGLDRFDPPELDIAMGERWLHSVATDARNPAVASPRRCASSAG